MSIEIFRTQREAIESLRGHLGLATCPSFESRFEILRTTVWSMAAPNSKAHVNRVLNSALPTWRLISERATASDEALREELRVALALLDDTGDLIELSGGYWAPATARIVELPARVGHLLVGGVPSALLDRNHDAIEFHGPHRHLAKLSTALAAGLCLEDLKSWARLPDVRLQDWARDVIKSRERQPYLPTSGDAFEFYFPEKSKPGTPQFKRWLGDAGSTTGPLLARRIRLYGAREYRLVDVRSGRIVGACELHDVDVRRLMYALDSAASNPVRAQRLGSGQSSVWRFISELPRPEQRAFAAFGTLTIPDDRPFERRWTFVRNEELALDMLRSLGIALEQ
jgi:hypothetical protein